MLTLDQVIPGSTVVIEKVGGARSFRRRLMELGIIPGIKVEVLRIAPFGDPLELTVRGCNLSIRASQARQVEVESLPTEARVGSSASAAPATGRGSSAPVTAWEPGRPSAVSGLAKSAP
jgi:Fe2+ transport system protein FeoA